MASVRLAALTLTGLALALCCQASRADSSAITDTHVEPLLRDSTKFWTQQFADLHGRYTPPGISYFSHALQKPCKLAVNALGPFYCPANQHLYIDQTYLAEAIARAGPAASALRVYLIGHEVAHHVQAINGRTAAVEQARSRSSPELAARTLLAMELQADCYAGLWLRWAANHGDVVSSAELPKALSALADVSRQRQLDARGKAQLVDPLTHGTEAQRLHWLRQGRDGGTIASCDTFAAESAGKL